MAQAALGRTTFVIDRERCMGCGACLDVCFPKAIEVRGTVFMVDASRCDGCGLCARYCPLRAITPSR